MTVASRWCGHYWLSSGMHLHPQCVEFVLNIKGSCMYMCHWWIYTVVKTGLLLSIYGSKLQNKTVRTCFTEGVLFCC